MNAFERKIALRVVGIHAGIILLLLITSALRGCFRPKPKEIVTFFEIADPVAAVSVEAVDRMADPVEPPPAPEPVKPPTPGPPPQALPIPEPVKPTLTKREKPRPAEPVTPKWTPTKASDIDPTKAKRINEAPVKPVLSAADISRALKDLVPRSSASGNPNRFASYDAQIYKVFYGAWSQPASPAARPANVRISILDNGRITARKLVQSSGDSTFDQTVMDAVNRVTTLPRPPKGYPRDNIVVQFRIID